MPTAKAALVIGAGDATGGAIARRFAREGFIACVTRRNADKLQPLVERIKTEGGSAHGFGSDARDEAQMSELVTRIERDIAPIEVAVFNIGANVRFAVTETTERVYRKVWEMGALAGLPDGPRSGARDDAARPRHDPVHRRHAPACAARPASPRSPAPSTRCVRWRRAWRASWARRASTSRTS